MSAWLDAPIAVVGTLLGTVLGYFGARKISHSSATNPRISYAGADLHTGVGSLRRSGGRSIGSRLTPSMGTPWDARTYDETSEPQQAWAAEVLARLEGIAENAAVLDVGCGTGRVTEALLALVPRGHVLAIDASADMVALARQRLGDRAQVWCQDVLDLDLDEPVDAIVSTATLHWVTDHDRLWTQLAQVLRSGGPLEVQCGGEGNIEGVREVIEAVASEVAPELLGWSPWVFAGPQETERRLRDAGFSATRCWLEERPTYPEDVDVFVRTSILAAHLARLPEERRERFAAAIVADVHPPLDYVRLNVSAVRS
jgi:trans-aconitate 2-methyltransferase